MNGAYYNEHDPFAAAWLRNLISSGLIAHGEVDERDIRAVQPDDLKGYSQHHFFAGIGGWSYALRLAGWPDDRPVWTGSCPCQPFSSAGKGEGFNDPRHLWPAWFRLIRECRPPVVFGEQVASKAGLGWVDLVATQLEAEDYAFGAADLCAAGVKAPHIRQRLFFVADATDARRNGGAHGGATRRTAGAPTRARKQSSGRGEPERESADGDRALADAHAGRRRTDGERQGSDASGATGAMGSLHGSATQDAGASGLCADCGEWTQRCECPLPAWRMAHHDGERLPLGAEPDGEADEGERTPRWADAGGCGGHGVPDWSDVVWLPCRDGKARPTKPGIFPLAHGVPNRVGTLRGAGNAIVPQAAAEFITAWCEMSA